MSVQFEYLKNERCNSLHLEFPPKAHVFDDGSKNFNIEVLAPSL
jgi:hypothetical protein